MKRSLLIACALLLLCAGSLYLVFAQQKDSQANEVLVARLDEILPRLKAIENRLQRLEEPREMSNTWRRDKHGILRTEDGSAIGWWGVDWVNKNY